MPRLVIRLVFLATIFAGCSAPEKEILPVLGRHEYINKADGTTDTIYHSIKPFSFVDQDSLPITNETYKNKIYVADFFFTSCPSICPVMKVQMLRVYEKYVDNPQVGLLSHSIDPEYDNVAVLKDYAERLEVKSSKWHFVTGDKSEIYDMAQTSYYVGARENEQAPGGYEHSGAFILVDPERHIRGVYNGTDPESINKLLKDIDTLLQEIAEK